MQECNAHISVVLRPYQHIDAFISPRQAASIHLKAPANELCIAVRKIIGDKCNHVFGHFYISGIDNLSKTASCHTRRVPRMTQRGIVWSLKLCHTHTYVVDDVYVPPSNLYVHAHAWQARTSLAARHNASGSRGETAQVADRTCY